MPTDHDDDTTRAAGGAPALAPVDQTPGDNGQARPNPPPGGGGPAAGAGGRPAGPASEADDAAGGDPGAETPLEPEADEPTAAGRDDDPTRTAAGGPTQAPVDQPPGDEERGPAAAGAGGGRPAGPTPGAGGAAGGGPGAETLEVKASGPGVQSVTLKFDDYRGRLDKLVADVRKHLRPGLPAEVQAELAELLHLVPRLQYVEYGPYVPLAEVAADALTSAPPNLDLARSLRGRIEKHLGRPLSHQIFSSNAPAIRLVIGLGALVVVAVPLAVMLYNLLSSMKAEWASSLFGLPVNTVALVAFFGILGSAVSIMVRIDKFADLRNVDPLVLFFIGFFKPIIGMAFALFVYVSINAKLLPVVLPEQGEHFMFAALAFVSGFSERFATDVATRAAGVTASTPPKDGRGA